MTSGANGGYISGGSHYANFSHGIPSGRTSRYGQDRDAVDDHSSLSYDTSPGASLFFWSGNALKYDNISNYHYHSDSSSHYDVRHD